MTLLYKHIHTYNGIWPHIINKNNKCKQCLKLEKYALEVTDEEMREGSETSFNNLVTKITVLSYENGLDTNCTSQ